MDLTLKKAAILGATGPTGKHLARELCTRGIATRVVSRSPENLAAAFADFPVDPMAADLRDAAETTRAMKACDVVFDCVGVPLRRIDDHLTTARNIAEAAKDTEVRLVHVSSYWAYLPAQRLPLTESHPRLSGPKIVQLRREAEDVLRAAGAAVVNLPDFYGPEVHSSTLQRALEEICAGKAVNWIGSPATEREYVYVPDAMKIVADLAQRQEAYGQRWVLGGAGPISLERIAEIAERHLGRRPALRGASPWLLRLFSIFSAQLRAMMPLVPAYVQPISYDDKKLRRLLPQAPVTPYEAAIPQTLDWLARKGRACTSAEMALTG